MTDEEKRKKQAEKENEKRQKKNDKENKKRTKEKEKQSEKENKERGQAALKKQKQRVEEEKNKLKQLEKEKKVLEDHKKDLDKNIKKAKDQTSKLEKTYLDKKSRYENLKANKDLYTPEEIAAAKAEMESALAALNKNKDSIKSLEEEYKGMDAKISAKDSEINTQKEVLSKEEGEYEQVKSLVASGTPADITAAENIAGNDPQPTEEETEETTVVPEKDAGKSSPPPPIAPWDTRLYRTDSFVKGGQRIPLSSEEASSILADMISFDVTDKGHGIPNDKKQYGILANDPNVYGLLSLINPYSITRLYNGLKDMSFTNQDKTIAIGENRMLDIRDKKRFYDTKVRNNAGDEVDVLSVSNPTVTNIIQLMNDDRWGRTPYTYQDFVFCKYFGRIPTNRLITLRKYAAATNDNLCWEMMGEDAEQMNKSFSPIATACTYFGGESGNTLKDLFSIESGLNWEPLKAEIWSVTGDSGESQQQVADQKNLANTGTNGTDTTKSPFINTMFRGGGKILGNATSVLKFIGATGNPNVFSQQAANSEQFYANLHDPNDGGPYANRIQGPLNRIDTVMKRKEGIKFNHKITLKFAFEARPIGGVNTKAVMMEIISNMLLLCSASAVFWGGGHKFMIQPHAYPWNNLDTNTRGFLKSVYNGQFFGKKGAIAQALQGMVSVGHGVEAKGGFNFKNVIDTLGNIGAGVLGVLGGALNTLVGSISGSFGEVGDWIEKGNAAAQQLISGNNMAQKGASAFTNLLKNTQSIWKANSVKQTILPSVQGLRSLLLGTPVGNWHLTIGNPLNPIAVIGNLICQDIKFEFGEELGPDDFPINLNCTVTLEHGMPRDLAAIESMFNRGAGRIYQAPDYLKLWGKNPVSEEETKVDKMTGGTQVRVPEGFLAVEGQARAGKYFSRNIANSSTPSNAGNSDSRIDKSALVDAQKVIDYNRGATDSYGVSTTYVRRTSPLGQRSTFRGNLSTRHYTDS